MFYISRNLSVILEYKSATTAFEKTNYTIFFQIYVPGEAEIDQCKDSDDKEYTDEITMNSDTEVSKTVDCYSI